MIALLPPPTRREELTLAVSLLRAARACLEEAKAPRALSKVRVALASTEAALRYHDDGIGKGVRRGGR